MNITWRCLLLAGLSCQPLLAMQAAEPAAVAAGEPAPVIDRLQHAPGTVTGKAGIAHVERRGSGPIPLVLIAGAPFGWQAWEGFMARNEARYTMFAVTPAGYAGTPPPPMPDADHQAYEERVWTEALLHDLATLIEDEIVAPGKLGPAVMVGHHLMADYYAVRLAAEHPELVRAVVSVAGMGSFPMKAGGGDGNEPADSEARARFVRDSRAPYFGSVAQDTWNANTFQARSLSKDADRGRQLFEDEVAVPISTQVRYYLEYMTDRLEPALQSLKAPVLALEIKPQWSFENLSDAMKQQLVQRFGSEEEARKQVHFGGAWDTLAASQPSVRVQQIANAGIFMMDDAPAAFDEALAQFLAAAPADRPDASSR